jgi:hypothetical protein
MRAYPGGAGGQRGGFLPVVWPGNSGGVPSSPDGGRSAIDALTDSMQSTSFSSPEVKRGSRSQTRRKNKKPCLEDLEEARQRTIYVSDLNKGITETELVRWFTRAGQVLECRICSDMNTVKRFAFVEFRDQNSFEAGRRKALAPLHFASSHVIALFCSGSCHIQHS